MRASKPDHAHPEREPEPRARRPAHAVGAGGREQADPHRHDEAEEPEVVPERRRRRGRSARRAPRGGRRPPGRRRAARRRRRRGGAGPTPPGACRASPALLPQLEEEPLVGVRDAIPRVVDAHALRRAPPQRCGEGGVLQEALERRPEARAADPAVIALAGVADGLEILRRVVDEDGGARPHRLEERRVRARPPPRSRRSSRRSRAARGTRRRTRSR